MHSTHTVYQHILTTFIAMVHAKGTIHSSHGSPLVIHRYMLHHYKLHPLMIHLLR